MSGKSTTKTASQVARTQQRRVELAKLYIEGTSHIELASRFKISLSQVNADIAAIKKAWLQSALRNFDEAKSQELARLDYIEQQAIEGWYRSIRDKKREAHKETDKGGENGPEISDERVTEAQAGDPRFLEQMTKCVDMRCKIFGLYKEVKIDMAQYNINWDQVRQEAQQHADTDPAEEAIKKLSPGTKPTGTVIDGKATPSKNGS